MQAYPQLKEIKQTSRNLISCYMIKSNIKEINLDTGLF